MRMLLSIASLTFFLCSISLFGLESKAHESTACEAALDPFLWLEEIEGQAALDWVGSQNTIAKEQLESDPRYPELLENAQAILYARDRIPFSSFYRGSFHNFWQDKEHQHGLLRQTSYDNYISDTPNWEVILDLDKLSAEENENWVYAGQEWMDRASNRTLIYLSRGGKDATVVREFDGETKSFVRGGFAVSEAKTNLTPIDEDTVLIGTDYGHGSLTESGYPRIMKLWKRGQSLNEAPVIFEGEKTDMAIGAAKIQHGSEKWILLSRALDFYRSEYHVLMSSGEVKKLNIPDRSRLIDIRNGKVYIHLREDLLLADRRMRSGDVVRYDLDKNGVLRSPKLIYSPKRGESIENIQIGSDRIFLTLLRDVRGVVLQIKAEDEAGIFAPRELPFPSTGALSFAYRDEDDPTSFSTLYYSDHLTPYTQYRVYDEDESFRLEVLKRSPARFDANDLEVEQHFATSKDGTQVPYFLIRNRGQAVTGDSPTILYGYGGFEVSLTPSYQALVGKLWLERGGTYVIANIRGGGEYGPKWHQAALKEKRQNAFDDFAAVAEDLILKNITSPEKLGIAGASNGGLLAGVTLVQRPDLISAALIQVPLLDMIRYSKLLAGASWVGEYGDPDVEGERKFLHLYSPYHNLSKDKRYPAPLITTSTKDDRVHPGHARKMVARMLAMGHQVLYYENTDGGHAGSADLEGRSKMTALEYTYMWLKLHGESGSEFSP